MLEPERMMAHHAAARVAWVRAAALRANGGIVALGALLIGVAAAAGGEGDVLLAGLAGLFAGALAVTMADYSIIAARNDRAGPPGHSEGGRAAGADPVVNRRGAPAEDLVAGAAGGLADDHGASALQVALTSGAIFALGGTLPLAAAAAFRLSALPLGVGLVSLGGVALLARLGSRATGLAAGLCTARTTGFAAVGLAAAFAVGRLFGTAVI